MGWDWKKRGRTAGVFLVGALATKLVDWFFPSAWDWVVSCITSEERDVWSALAGGIAVGAIAWATAWSVRGRRATAEATTAAARAAEAELARLRRALFLRIGARLTPGHPTFDSAWTLTTSIDVEGYEALPAAERRLQNFNLVVSIPGVSWREEWDKPDLCLGEAGPAHTLHHFKVDAAVVKRLLVEWRNNPFAPHPTLHVQAFARTRDGTDIERFNPTAVIDLTSIGLGDVEKWTG